MIPTQIPDPATLEGEELNYWCGVAAGKTLKCGGCGWPLKHSIDDGCVVGNCSMRPVPCPDTRHEVYTYSAVRWNPREDAAQCLEITERYHVEPALIGSMASRDGKHWSSGETELIARCRAFLEAKRREG